MIDYDEMLVNSCTTEIAPSSVATPGSTISPPALMGAGRSSAAETFSGDSLEKAGKKWDTVEEARLISMLLNGSSFEKIAARLGRSPLAIAHRLLMLSPHIPHFLSSQTKEIKRLKKELDDLQDLVNVLVGKN